MGGVWCTGGVVHGWCDVWVAWCMLCDAMLCDAMMCDAMLCVVM